MADTVKEVSELERKNGELALKIAEEGIVLLENNGALPIKAGKVALYGSGARKTCKGGTGSGDVNNRENINVEQGLEKCGFTVTTKSWLDDCDAETLREESIRDAKLREIGKKYSIFRFWDLMNELSVPIIFPKGRDITEKDVLDSDTDTAVYVLARQAGEGADRRNSKGEYYPTDKEINDVRFLVSHYKNTVLVINAGACIDMKDLLAEKPGAVVYMGQAGQAGGLALAKLMSGECNFSGKLAATWPEDLRDLPCADSYSYLDGNTDRELYKDGIYVGYRFYDAFGVKPQYAFGHGLSYTKFDVDASASLDGSRVNVKAKVSNVGDRTGKEVVQVYICCPSGRIKREKKQLAAFVKTADIAAGKSVMVSTSFDLADFAAYDEERSCFVLEAGNYIVRVGTDPRELVAVATVVLKREYVTEECRPIPNAKNRVEEISPAAADAERPFGVAYEMADDAIRKVVHCYVGKKTDIVPAVEKMSDKELSALCAGDPSLMRGGILDVVGACGQINRKVCRKYGFSPAVMADGPAGLRLIEKYAVEPNGKIKTEGKLPKELIKAKKFFYYLDKLWSTKSKRAKDVYQYCTAWPTATVQAQTFSPELIVEAGEAVSREMVKFGVKIWLAPGMNIQRHPLCGRNFEYYSEDPVLTAAMASAITEGVQKDPRCAVTIKHYCCNNQEDNRMKSSSEVNERALREIYLKAFKTVLRDSNPKCVMSSYNKVNGTYVNSSKSLISDVLRCEFGFDGVVMTDWQSVAKDQADAGEVLAAENDIVMAGDKYQTDQLFEAVSSGRTARQKLMESASRILSLCSELSK